MTESTTPRTDAEVYAAGTQDAGNRVVPAAFARTLERELTEGRANHAAWVEESIATTQELSRLQADEVARLDCELAAARQSLSEGISAWIPVEERLPEDGQMVLGFLPATNQYPISMESLTYLASDAPDSVEAWLDWQDERSDAPTHWMPLPEAPK